MNINKDILEKIKNSSSRLLLVTKYLDNTKTMEIIDFMEGNYIEIIEWFWENRVASLKEKEIPREICHFIWNIQTKEIKYITEKCSVIHSLDSEKHLRKIEEICSKQWNWIEVFLQINVDSSKDWWIKVDEIPKFLEIFAELENVSLVWFSAIWKSEFTKEEKEEEFELLLSLRDKYLPNWFVSAWTSLDYEIAIEKWVDILRIWSRIFE